MNYGGNSSDLKTKGFTLAELIVAVAVLGIVIAIALPVINNLKTKNENKKYESYENSIISSSKIYVDSYGNDRFDKKALNTQCISIGYDELKSYNLLKSYKLDGVECTGKTDNVVAYVTRDKSGNYKYYPTIVCTRDGREIYKTKNAVPAVCNNIDDSKVVNVKSAPSCVSNSNAASMTIDLKTDNDEGNSITELSYSLIESVNSNNQDLIRNLEYTKISDLTVSKNIDITFGDKIPQDVKNKNYKLVLKYRYLDSDDQYEVLNKIITVNYAEPKIEITAKKYDREIDTANIKNYDTYKNNDWTNKNVYVKATATDGCGKEIAVILPDGSSNKKAETKVIAVDQEVKKQELVFKAKYGNNKTTEEKFNVRIDKEKPVCGIAASGTLGDNNWYTSDVRLDMSRDDKNGSGIVGAVLTTSKTPSYNGTSLTDNQTDNTNGQTWYGYVKDNVGNVNKCYKTIKVDKSSPTCSIRASGTKGDNNWYTSNVKLTMTNGTSTSGIAGYKLTTSKTPSYNKKNLTGDQKSNTKGQKWYGYIKNNAGNVSKCSISVKVDKDLPTCSISTSGTKGNNNWYTSNVKLTMTNGTSTSGIAGYKLTTSKTPSYNKKNLTGDQKSNTKGQKWYGYIKNNAGRVNTCDITIKVDKEAPKFVEKLDMTTCGITNDHGYYKFGYTFTDNLSGISTNNAYFKYCYQIEEGEEFSGNTCSNNRYGSAKYNWGNANDGALSGKFLSGVSICLSRKSAVKVIKADLKICDRAGNCSTKKASYTPPKNKCNTLIPWPCAN